MDQDNLMQSGLIVGILAVVATITAFGEEVITSRIMSAIALALSLYISIKQVWIKPPNIKFQETFFKHDIGSTPITQYRIAGSVMNSGDRSTNFQIKKITAPSEVNITTTEILHLQPEEWMYLEGGETKPISFILNMTKKDPFSLKIEYRFIDKIKVKVKVETIKNFTIGETFLER